MQHSLIHLASGFSLIEAMVSLVFYATVVTALMGYFRVIAQGLDLQWQNRQLWRQVNEQADIIPPVLPTVLFTKLPAALSGVGMLRVYHSNRLDVLEEIMEFIIERQHLDNPFESEVVLVQSTGMAQWLQMSLARRFGVAANIDFPLPARFIWEMFICVLDDIPKESAFTKQNMSWKLMNLLPSMLERPEFAMLSHYLEDDDDRRKLFQLASRIADLYDQYLVYRPAWLTRWEAGEWVEGLNDTQRWQAILWKALVEHTSTLGQPGWHRANLYQRFISRLKQAKNCPVGLPSRVFICGISALPPIYLLALEALGKHIDVHLLFTNPCRYYWGDIKDAAFLSRLQHRRRQSSVRQESRALFKDNDAASSLFNDDGEQASGNPLLASWGKPGRDYTFLLSGLERFEEYDVFVDVEPGNLLQNLHYDLLELNNAAIEGSTLETYESSTVKLRLEPDDRSITFHVCHSPQREVEILHDRLLAMLEADPELTPRDIIVMVADIDSYSPYIQAVFGSASQERWLPFAISDRRATEAHPSVQAFLTLLSLPDSRFVSEDVLALLEVPALAACFNIDEKGLRYLRQWVHESGIRWGMDDDNVRELSLPVTGQHTWQFGLTRMLLGYAMESSAGEWRSVLPYDESSGLIASLVGHLADFLMQLNLCRKTLIQARPLEAWLPVCRDMLGSFFLPDPDTEAALALVEEQWQAMIEQGIDAHYHEAVSLTLLRDELSQRLDKERISQRFLAGPVNFCTLMPMRSIPFKVVCLLGMNDGVYPRTLSPLGFDLMSQKPQRGDRSRRDDDRYLFLEALLSARQQLYISFIGRDIQDNSERFPSVLVQELLDYIAQSHCLMGDEMLNCDDSARRVKNHLLWIHPRTPFDSVNFLPSSEGQSYAREWLPAANGQGIPHDTFMKTLSPYAEPEIDVDQLQHFWLHPVRAFFQIRLGVNFHLETSELPDTEPFTLDSLHRYRLNQQLLNALVEGHDTGSLFRRYRAAGELPYGAFGEIFWDAQRSEMQVLADRVLKERTEGRSLEVDLTLNNTHLSGWLMNVQHDGLLRWRPSQLGVREGLQLWTEHLIYCASGHTGESRLYGRHETRWHFPSLEKSEAERYLAILIDGFRQGMRTPLILLPKSGGAWLDTCYDKATDSIKWDEETQQKASNRLLQAFEGNQMMDGEGRDIWYQRLWRSMVPDYYAAIIEQTQRYLLPLLRFNQS